MKKIEVGKSYKTRDGQEVRIYAVEVCGELPIHGAVLKTDGTWNADAWKEDGTSYFKSDSDLDIVMEPLKYEGVARIASYFEGGNPKIYVPIEFAGLEVEYTLKEVEPCK